MSLPNWGLVSKGSVFAVCFLLLATVFAVPSFAYELEYDANGNLIEDDQYKYTYNEANQLFEVRTLIDDIVARYWYDVTGRRIKKELYDGTITYYPFNNYEEVHYPNGTIEKTVYYFANGERLAKNVSVDSSSDVQFYHSDHLGSTNVVTDNLGNLIEKTVYAPFGSVLAGGSDRYGFTGQEKDPETDLMYYGARYYNPLLRRFVQPDSFLQDIYDPQSLNRYSYVRNNPLIYVDPTGKFWDGFKDFLGDVWDGVTEVVSNAVDWIIEHPVEAVVIVAVGVATGGFAYAAAGAGAAALGIGGTAATMISVGAGGAASTVSMDVVGNGFVNMESDRSYFEGITPERLAADAAWGAATAEVLWVGGKLIGAAAGKMGIGSSKAAPPKTPKVAPAPLKSPMAVIPDEKVTQYLLTDSSKVGFQKIGFSQSDPSALKSVLTQQFYNSIDDPLNVPQASQYGLRYKFSSTVTGPNGQAATMESVWQKVGEKTYQLITAWAKVHK